MHCLNLPPKLANGSRGVVSGFRRPKQISPLSLWYLEKLSQTGLPVVHWNKTPESPGFTSIIEPEVYERPAGQFIIQLPGSNAHALTIHKAVGSTLEAAVIDCSGGLPAEHALYEALSRCRSSDVIQVLNYEEALPLKISKAAQYNTMLLEQDAQACILRGLCLLSKLHIDNGDDPSPFPTASPAAGAGGDRREDGGGASSKKAKNDPLVEEEMDDAEVVVYSEVDNHQAAAAMHLPLAPLPAGNMAPSPKNDHPIEDEMDDAEVVVYSEVDNHQAVAAMHPPLAPLPAGNMVSSPKNDHPIAEERDGAEVVIYSEVDDLFIGIASLTRMQMLTCMPIYIHIPMHTPMCIHMPCSCRYRGVMMTPKTSRATMTPTPMVLMVAMALMVLMVVMAARQTRLLSLPPPPPLRAKARARTRARSLPQLSGSLLHQLSQSSLPQLSQ